MAETVPECVAFIFCLRQLLLHCRFYYVHTASGHSQWAAPAATGGFDHSPAAGGTTVRHWERWFSGDTQGHDVRLDADASSAALRATLGALDEPVFEGVIAAHSASTDSRSAPPAFGRTPPPVAAYFRPTVVLHGPGAHSALHSGPCRWPAALTVSSTCARHQVRKHQVP